MATKIKKGSKAKSKAKAPKNTSPTKTKKGSKSPAEAASKKKSTKKGKAAPATNSKAKKAKSSKKVVNKGTTKSKAAESNGTNGRGKVTLNTNLLVGLTEISDKADVSRSAVGNWVNRYEDFPEPVVTLASGPVFYWPEVKTWLKETGRK